MNKALQIILILLATHFCAGAEKRKILFLGNSYTYVNDLPNTLRQLALSLGDSLEVDSYCPGGATLNILYNDASAMAKIQMPGWDYVVIQAQSQEPSFSPGQVQINTYPFAKKLDSVIHITNPCAETVFYMTWGRKNGDAGNCVAYPPVCTYEGMQQRLRESYLEMSDDNNATCSPVGAAWRNFRALYPGVNLYDADESHPSVNGTYLAACVFYTTIFQKSTAGAGFVPAGVAAADAANLQSVASNTVLDSIENWQQNGNLPFADFNFTINQNQVSFTNASLRASQYEWDFGDLSPINNTMNPSHTFTTAGNYTVTLKAKSTCNKYAVNNKSINIVTIPSALNEMNASSGSRIYYHNKKLYVQGVVSALAVTNQNGAVVLCEKNALSGIGIDCAFLPAGIYFYNAVTNRNTKVSGSFIVGHD